MTIAKRTPPGLATEGSNEKSHVGRTLDVDSINLEAYLDPADRLMLAALRDGTYVLAVRCRRCGAPLTARRSRARGIGPSCRSLEAGGDA